MLDLYRVFVKTVELGSFSQAAQQLNLSPSAVSRKIDALEQELEIKLFNRTTRQLILTDSGQLVLASAKQQLNAQQALITQLQERRSEPQGTITISVFESFGRIKLAPLLPHFMKQYPQVHIHLALDNQLVDLYRDEIDLAIRIGPSTDSTLRSKLLFKNQLVLCASPDYLARYGEPQHPSHLSEHSCLLLQPRPHAMKWHFYQGKKRQSVTVRGNFSTNGGSGVLEAACQGQGISLISKWSVQQELDNGQLVTILDQWRPACYDSEQTHIYALFKDDQFMNPALRHLLDYLTQKFHPMPIKIRQ